MNARILQRLANIVHHVLNDRTVRVRPGPLTAYFPDHHIVEIAEDVFTWTDDEVLAVGAHEGSHAVLTRYPDSPVVRRLPQDELGVLNWFEDERVDTWSKIHLPGLRAGFEALREKAFSHTRGTTGIDLGLSGGSLPPHVAFTIELRARAAGLRPRACADVIEVAIVECVADVAGACARVPDTWRPDEESIELASGAFVRVMVDRVLPRYRELKNMSRDGQPPAALAKLEELERRLADATRGPLSGNAWVGLRRAQQGARKPLIEAGLAAYDHTERQLSAQIGSFVARLDDALAANRAGGVFEYGFASGQRIDLRQATQLQRDPGRVSRMWARRTPPDDKSWRLLIAADTSQSMAGERLKAVQHMVILTLEAADRLGLPTGLLLFGHGDRNENRGVTLVKEMFEPLSAARPNIERSLFGGDLGTETPLAAALDRCRHILGDDEPDIDDLVLVITDGMPRWSEETFLAEEAETTCVGDDGKTTGEKTVSRGRRLFWLPQHRCLADVKRAYERLTCERKHHVVGVGLGENAPVHDWFPTAVRYDGADDFAAKFPRYLGDLLERFLRST